jgi:hypothetical protein
MSQVNTIKERAGGQQTPQPQLAYTEPPPGYVENCCNLRTLSSI